MIQNVPGMMLRFASAPIASGIVVDLDELLDALLHLLRAGFGAEPQEVAFGGLEEIERLLLVAHDGLDLDRAVPVDRDVEGRPASRRDSFVRFSATPKFASWKRSTSNWKRSWSSATSSAVSLPEIAFQRRFVTSGGAAERARLGAAEAREVAEADRRSVRRPVAGQREAVADLQPARLDLELAVLLELQQLPRHTLELVEADDGAVGGLDRLPVPADDEPRHLLERRPRVEGLHDLAEGELALADADGGRRRPARCTSRASRSGTNRPG